MSSELKLFSLLFFSAIGTLIAWRKIIRRDNSPIWKTVVMLITAIPLFGPLSYIFIAPPSVKPVEQRDGLSGGSAIATSSFDPLIKFLRNLFRI